MSKNVLTWWRLPPESKTMMLGEESECRQRFTAKYRREGEGTRADIGKRFLRPRSRSIKIQTVSTWPTFHSTGLDFQRVYSNYNYLRILSGTPDRWRCPLRSARNCLDWDTGTVCSRALSLAGRCRNIPSHTCRNYRPPCCADKCTGLQQQQQKCRTRYKVFGNYNIIGIDVVTCVRVTNGGVSVTITRDARRERTAASGLVSWTGRARFAKLSDVSFGTRAHLYPIGRQSRSAASSRLQREVVQEPDACTILLENFYKTFKNRKISKRQF